MIFIRAYVEKKLITIAVAQLCRVTNIFLVSSHFLQKKVCLIHKNHSAEQSGNWKKIVKTIEKN